MDFVSSIEGEKNFCYLYSVLVFGLLFTNTIRCIRISSLAELYFLRLLRLLFQISRVWGQLMFIVNIFRIVHQFLESSIEIYGIWHNHFESCCSSANTMLKIHDSVTISTGDKMDYSIALYSLLRSYGGVQMILSIFYQNSKAVSQNGLIIEQKNDKLIWKNYLVPFPNVQRAIVNGC